MEPLQTNLVEMAAELSALEGVTWAEPNRMVRMAEIIPNDNFYQAQQENLRVIRMPAAWEITTGEPLVIAVVDTGIDLQHGDLEGKIWQNSDEYPGNGLDDDQNGLVDDAVGWDFRNGDDDPDDDQGHGSHVAGVAAAASNNGIGIAGVSWGARLMALKALNSSGDGTWADVAAAVLYAADQGAQVINLSLGDPLPSETMAAAAEYAYEKGSLLVAASGNGGGAVLYPAAIPGVLAVAATNNQDIPWAFSNRGPEVDLAAPGVDIFSTNHRNSYLIQSGTSMAAAHVSGAAALVWGLRPELRSDEVATILFETCEDVWSNGYDELTGWGRLDVYRAALRTSKSRAWIPYLHVQSWKSVFLPFLGGG